MKIDVILGDALEQSIECDMIVTDPPFDMSGSKLAEIISSQKSDHLLLITTMRQLIGFCNNSEWKIGFDFVLDHVVPKKSKSVHQPNYIHSTCAYMTRNGAKSLFNRKKRERSDTYDGKGYWPTILRAQRNRMQELGYAKNTQTITDIIGCFDVNKVCDLFAGSGTTGLAAFELGIDCVLVEKDIDLYSKLKKKLNFVVCY